MWLSADFHHQYGADAAVTRQPFIQMLVFGWRRAKSCSMPIEWPWRDLFRSANAGTDMCVITSWLNANYPVCWAKSLKQWKATERETYCSVIMQNINFSEGFSLNFYFCSQSKRISFISNVKVKRMEWKRQIFNNSSQRICFVKSSSENGVQHRGMKALRFTTICEPLSNTRVQPLLFFLIHSVKLQPRPVWLHQLQLWILTTLADMCCVTSPQNGKM